MDAQTIQIDERRSKRAQVVAFTAPLDVVAATRSATAFFVWYAGAMLNFHVAMVCSACKSMNRVAP